MTPERRARNCGMTACVIAITPNVLVSNTFRTCDMGVASKSTHHADPRIVDECVDGAARVEGGGDAFRFGDIERQHAQPVRLRQDVLARMPHRGDDVPALGMEVARGLQAIA